MKKHRSESGLFVAEGRDMLDRAKALGWAPHTVILRDGSETGALAAWCEATGGRCLVASELVMEAVSRKAIPPTASACSAALA